jgi:hypothetical protein
VTKWGAVRPIVAAAGKGWHRGRPGGGRWRWRSPSRRRTERKARETQSVSVVDRGRDKRKGIACLCSGPPALLLDSWVVLGWALAQIWAGTAGRRGKMQSVVYLNCCLDLRRIVFFSDDLRRIIAKKTL